MAHVLADGFQIEMLQTSVARVVEKNHDQHDFCLGKCPITMIMPLSYRLYSVLLFAILQRHSGWSANT